MSTYKMCSVPMCNNNTLKCPEKLFIHVPKCPKRRKQWLELARRDLKCTSVKSTIYFCEDHFDLPNDMENFMKYSVLGSVRKKRMSSNCLPSKFECQPDRIKRTAPPQPRSAVSKRHRKDIIEEILTEETEIPFTSKPKVAYETASKMPTSHQNENETPREMKHSPIKDWNSLTWVCYLCEESLNGFENLTKHQESLHKDRNKEKDHFICFDCKETLSEYSIFLNHIRSRHYNFLKLCCDVCNKVIPDYAQLADHREEHIEYTNEIHPNVYHCNLCEEVAATERILKWHTQEYHDLKSRDATKEKDLSDLSEAEKVKYECPDDIEDESVVEDCVKCKDEYNDTEELFQCGQCVQNFKTETSLKRHMATHNNERPFKCDVCSKTYTTKGNLKSHMITHKSERPFKCGLCSKTFTTKAYLKTHMVTHNSERPFKCDVCSKTFKLKRNLNEHKATHNNERPFKCDVCFKKFKLRHRLNRHMATHNNERPFKCDVCSKTFTAKAYLKVHMKTHNSERPFECDVCSKKLTRKSVLKVHMKTHNNPFKCDVCSKMFKLRSLLNRHMIVHSVNVTISTIEKEATLSSFEVF